MNAHLKSSLILVLVTSPISFVGGCQLSTAESRAQTVATVENRNTMTVQQEKSQPPLKLLPVDESNLDPSFQEFRNLLTIAVSTYDKEFLLSILDQKIDNGYDIEPGVAEFKKNGSWTSTTLYGKN